MFSPEAVRNSIRSSAEFTPTGTEVRFELHPLSSDIDVGFIKTPGIVGLLQIWAAAFFKFKSYTLDLAVDGGVIQR